MYDAIVVGLGGMGSAAAYHLAGRGRRVLGLEQYDPAHDRGSSHGRSRIIRQAYAEDPSYVPLLLRAYELWERLERETGRELMTLTGGLMIGDPESEVVLGSLKSAREHDLPYEMLDAKEIQQRFPPLNPHPDTVALFEERVGFVRPEESVRAHLDRAAELGAELRFGEGVLSWEAPEEKVRVETTTGSYEAGHLVLSPGAWAPGLLEDIGIPFEVERQVMYWFEPEKNPELFSADRFPVFIWEPEDGRIFYGIPDRPDGVKAAFHHGGEKVQNPDTLDREVREGEVDLIRSYLREYVPALDGKLLEARACMYTNTPDLHFVIGAHPRHPRVALACGFSGHGYKFCGVVGEILADLITEGATSHPVDLFSPTRLSPSGR